MISLNPRRGICFFIIFGLLIASCGQTDAQESKHLYVLWQGLEPDKCAVTWLIIRFVDPAADFRIVRKGTTIDGAIPLDTPDSKIQRTHNRSAFEVALDEFGLQDRKLRRIGRIIWDIEINKWEKKVTAESDTLVKDIISIVRSESDPRKALEKTWGVFDRLYGKMGESK